MNASHTPYIPVVSKRKRLLWGLLALFLAGMLLWGLSALLASRAPRIREETVFSLETDRGRGAALLVTDDRTLLVCRHLMEDCSSAAATDRLGNRYAILGVLAFDERFALLRLSASSSIAPLSLLQGGYRTKLPLYLLTENTCNIQAPAGISRGVFSFEEPLESGALLTERGDLAGLACGKDGCGYSAELFAPLLAQTPDLMPLSVLSTQISYTSEQLTNLQAGGRLFQNEMYEYRTDFATLSILRTDRKGNVTDTGLLGINLLASGEMLYFLSPDQLVTRARSDGSDAVALSQIPVSCFQLWDGLLYLRTRQGDLISLNPETREETLLHTDVCSFFLAEDALFFAKRTSFTKESLKNGSLTTVPLGDFAALTLSPKECYLAEKSGRLWKIPRDTMKPIKQAPLPHSPVLLFYTGNVLCFATESWLYSYVKGQSELLRKGFPVSIYSTRETLFVNEKPLELPANRR